MCVGMCDLCLLQRSEDNFIELVLQFYFCLGSRDETQVVVGSRNGTQVAMGSKDQTQLPWVPGMELSFHGFWDGTQVFQLMQQAPFTLIACNPDNEKFCQ